ncbi:ATP-binding cassette domain-containing protein [Peptoclostridium litorale]|uniref:ATP-binding cassette domain-containing protein n=1 Tax=Peptoclostridium litorale TaxID=1557 RepID=UPI00069638EE|nr:ATP-binding cassette domain-containing protein [Peptoclostridium litorale]
MIEISCLKKSFGDLDVLDDINLNIQRGSIYGLVGRSGAGKSTLLRCMNGLESYDEGSILIYKRGFCERESQNNSKYNKLLCSCEIGDGRA